jgi:hypothetical protein
MALAFHLDSVKQAVGPLSPPGVEQVVHDTEIQWRISRLVSLIAGLPDRPSGTT